MSTSTLTLPPSSLVRECTYIPKFQTRDAFVKRFVDAEWRFTVPETADHGLGAGMLVDEPQANELFFLVDWSGSMNGACGGLSRRQAAHRAIGATLDMLPDGVQVAGRVFATNSADVMPRTPLTAASRALFKANLQRSIDVGGGTAIHTNVDRFLDDVQANKSYNVGIKNKLIVVFSDGQDNTGPTPWNDVNAVNGVMRRGLRVLAKKVRTIEKTYGCTVQLCFIGVSSEACWNVVRSVNEYRGLNGMGGVVNQDGLALTELMSAFVHRFLRTSYLETHLRIRVGTASLLSLLSLGVFLCLCVLMVETMLTRI